VQRTGGDVGREVEEERAEGGKRWKEAALPKLPPGGDLQTGVEGHHALPQGGVRGSLHWLMIDAWPGSMWVGVAWEWRCESAQRCVFCQAGYVCRGGELSWNICPRKTHRKCPGMWWRDTECPFSFDRNESRLWNSIITVFFFITLHEPAGCVALACPGPLRPF
jgi:hypothetical protein